MLPQPALHAGVPHLHPQVGCDDAFGSRGRGAGPSHAWPRARGSAAAVAAVLAVLARRAAGAQASQADLLKIIRKKKIALGVSLPESPTRDDLDAITVPDLRAALAQRGLDSKGTKSQLVQRLLDGGAAQPVVEQGLVAVEELRAGGFLGGARGYSSAIVACDKGNRWELSLSLLDEMMEKKLTPSPSAFAAVLNACERGGQLKHAEHVRRAQGGKPRETGQRSVAEAATAEEVTTVVNSDEVLYARGNLCARFREKKASPERLQKAAELLRSGGHFKETLPFTTALRNCEHGLHWEWALQFLSEMVPGGVEPDTVTYNVAIAALGRGQQWQRSLALMAGMPEQAGITPDFETYQAAALSCSRNGEWEQALAQLAEAQALGIANAETWNIAMMACASAAAWEAALVMLEAAGTSSAPADAIRDLNCFGVALYACMEAGKWQICLGILECMRREEVEADNIALACAVQACRDGKASAEASSIINEMLRRKLDTNIGEVLEEATVAIDFPEVRSPVPLSALKPMAAKEVSLYKFVRKRAIPGDVDSVLQAIEKFAEERSWLKIQGDDKRKLLERTIRPTDRIVEFGCYVGYSAILMARRLRELGGQGTVTTCEVDAGNAYVARGVIQFAGMEGDIQVRVGCANDWVSTGQLGTIDLLLLDHRGTIYHEDLHAAESSLSPHARVLADNVLYPGAPLFLHYIDYQNYSIEIHELKEFQRQDLDDWVVICTPPPPGERKGMPESTPPEMRRLSAEIDQISWRSQTAPVDWVAFQTRLKPIFYKWKADKGL
eukprot:TRINITY_DN103681_c0_g1_i1.p1 TRINITY_DN103681_c0_g1~~TRINITY_DN103681_c0_g1_i1.p1  ORF type:complete len:785 (-),score=154.41 TRINITY_DN103681_c0_g1_i1:13-2367(-)